ncbi:ABC transporter substrate-binding protein [Rhabdaerophilum calidifontis]|uniref:ABC transporter substrate-binding protein n=1 Tax=Rhabdaerophilum calidifontis TaxID=2604328 RepID=UPI00123B51CA
MIPVDRRRLLALGGAMLAAPALVGRAGAQTKVALGVGGKSLLYYLPLTIAERKGYFKEFGLDMEINDFAGGAKSLQALVGGSVDLVAGAYEHTIRMQAKGQDIRAVIEMLRFPTIVIGVRKAVADRVKSAKDFNGLKIGVTAPGSSTYITVLHAMAKVGLKAGDASFIGVGGGASAVAAMKKGEIDVISHLDPVIAKLEADGDIVTLIDTRTEKGTFDLFGGTNPAACLYVRQDTIEKNPATVQAAVNGLYKALRWINKAKPEEIADAVPEQYHLGDKALYIRAVKASQAAYSETGLMAGAGMKSVYDTLKALDPEMANVNVDLGKTFVPGFAAKAAQMVS